MRLTELTLLILFFSVIYASCQSSQREVPLRIVGGPCETCDALLEYDPEMINSSDTLPGYYTSNEKLLVTGTVYDLSNNAVENVIIYIYHTNELGYYNSTIDTSKWSVRHGDMRGWTKTDGTGSYSFYTSVPAAYPGLKEPAHIHFIVKEFNTIPYYIDDVVFDEDSLLTDDIRKTQQKRGGSGIGRIQYSDSLKRVVRDIYLGKNIPSY